MTRAMRAVRLLDAVEVRDIRMIERGENFGLSLKAGKPFRVAGDVRWKQLQRDLPLQHGVGRSVDLAHPAGSEQGDDFIRTEAKTGS